MRSAGTAATAYWRREWELRAALGVLYESGLHYRFVAVTRTGAAASRGERRFGNGIRVGDKGV